MHTFGAMTSKCKLAQHTREPDTTVSAGTSITAVCLSSHTKTLTKPMLVLISSDSNFLWRFVSHANCKLDNTDDHVKVFCFVSAPVV